MIRTTERKALEDFQQFLSPGFNENSQKKGEEHLVFDSRLPAFLGVAA